MSGDVTETDRDPMMNNLLKFAAAICAALFAHAAQASAPPSRADVKAETRAAEQAGKLTPAGEGAAPTERSTTASTKTRAERKAETLAARRQGRLAPAGTQPDYPKNSKSAGTKTRAERKAEARAAVKARRTVPAGEGPGAPTK